MSHLSEKEVERLLAARLGPAEQERVVRHLRAGCGLCSRKLVQQAPDRLLQEVADGRPRRVGPDSIRDHTLAAALKQEARWRTDEKKLAHSLEILRATPRGYDGFTLRQVQALHGPPLVEALLERSHEIRFRDPKAMRWLAYNAMIAADHLRPEEREALPRFDLQARAWAHLANAYRVNEEYAEAEGALGRARVLLRKGSGDLRLLALLVELEASLRKSQRRLAEASELLEGVYKLYVKLGDRQRMAQALISQGIGKHYGGSSRQAVQTFRQGLSLLDSKEDSQIISIGRQSLISALAGCGEHREAGELLLRSGLRQSLAGEPLSLLKIRWVEGTVQAGLGRTSRAERALREVHAEFLDLGQRREAAFVALELLPILLRQGRSGEVKEVARTTYGTFRDTGIHMAAANACRYLV
jgi:tetratricopeptide (TPR) repeat protein